MLAVLMVASACAVRAPTADDPPRHPPIDLDVVDLTWWFTCPTRTTEPTGCLAGPASGVAGARVLGPSPRVVVDEPGLVVTGSELGEVRVAAADVVLVGIDAEVVVFEPTADRGRLVGSRVGSVFVSGADEVTLVENLLRPSDPGPDVVQIKRFDGDPVRGLTVAGNVVGPQDASGDRHTDCVQVLDGNDLVFVRNLVGPCGDKAFQIRSGAGGRVGRVLLGWNMVMECRPRRDGCDGFHAVTWAVDGDARLELVHNSIAGSVALSTSGSSRPAAGRLVAIANIADALPCAAAGDAWANLVAGDGGTCPGEFGGSVEWVDAPAGDLHLRSRVVFAGDAPGVVGSAADPVTANSGFAALLEGPDVDGQLACGPLQLGADLVCP
ncbi:MAG: hypothetical protein D6798_00845 [Deltaproteobacteria bacterium]|nr:MAG: hypothetical protein D6798_00845 [Deltaproteobacteria bacterium]